MSCNFDNVKKKFYRAFNRVFKLSSNVNVQVVRSVLDLNDILSLVAKRRSQFLCNLDCVPFFKIILFFTSLCVVSFF